MLPVYLFCITYILLNPFLSNLEWVSKYDHWTFWSTLALRHGGSMGYVWIIRIFLIVMLVTPPLVQLEKKVKNGWIFYGLIGFMFTLQSLLPT